MADLLGIIVPLRKFFSDEDQTIDFSDGRKNYTVLSLEKGRNYYIPEYQREIRWLEEDVDLLIEDVSSGPRYLGNVIVTRKGNTFELIDGQQRITVLLMILAAIKEKHGSSIDVIESLCKLSIGSFEGFEVLIKNYFSKDIREESSIILSDKLCQRNKYYKLWDFINGHEQITDKRLAKTLCNNIEKSTINILLNNSDDQKDSIQYFVDVNLKGVKLDDEDIFKSYLFKNDKSRKIRLAWYDLKVNTMKLNQVGIKYTILELLRHYLYCDLFKNSRFTGLEFESDFCLKKQFKDKSDESVSYRKGSHIIEVVSDKEYMMKAITALNRTIEIMLLIVNTSPNAHEFRELFNLSKEQMRSSIGQR